MNIIAWVKKTFFRRSYLERESVTPTEATIFYKGKCPDCGAGLLVGPEGGLCQNVFCDSDSCGSKFNYMGPFGIGGSPTRAPRRLSSTGRRSSTRRRTGVDIARDRGTRWDPWVKNFKEWARV